MSRKSNYQSVRHLWRVRAWEWTTFAAAWTFRVLTWPVPGWALGDAMAHFGKLYAQAPGPRRRVDNNLRLIWPDMPAAARADLRRAIGASFLRLAVEYARLDRFARETAIEISGAHHLKDARKDGRGIVLVSAHYGNWEAVRLAAMRHGVESGIIYRAFNNRYLDRFTLDLIPCAGRPVLQKGREGMRKLVRHVRDGGTILILVDQRTTGAPLIPFLGQPAETVLAAAEIAQRYDAALIPAYATRNTARRRFDVVFEAPIAGAEPMDMMTQVNARISAWIAQNPEQWLWFHRRWRRKSPNPAN